MPAVETATVGIALTVSTQRLMMSCDDCVFRRACKLKDKYEKKNRVCEDYVEAG